MTGLLYQWLEAGKHLNLLMWQQKRSPFEEKRANQYCSVQASPTYLIRGPAVQFQHVESGYSCGGSDRRFRCGSPLQEPAHSFEIADLWGTGGTHVSIKEGSNSLYLSYHPDGAKFVASHVNSWEAFQLVDAGGNTVALKGGRDGKYCALRLESMADHLAGSGIVFSTHTGSFCTGSRRLLFCRSTAISPNQQFKVVRLGNGYVGLRSAQGQYFFRPTRGNHLPLHKQARVVDLGGLQAGGSRKWQCGSPRQAHRKYCALAQAAISTLRGPEVMVKISRTAGN